MIFSAPHYVWTWQARKNNKAGAKPVSNKPSKYAKDFWELAEDPKTDEVIRWSRDGRYCIVQDSAAFEKLVSDTSSFLSSKWPSIVRNLNYNGLRKLRPGKFPPALQAELAILQGTGAESFKPHVFASELFRRGRPDLLPLLREDRASNGAVGTPGPAEAKKRGAADGAGSLSARAAPWDAERELAALRESLGEKDAQLAEKDRIIHALREELKNASATKKRGRSENCPADFCAGSRPAKRGRAISPPLAFPQPFWPPPSLGPRCVSDTSETSPLSSEDAKSTLGLFYEISREMNTSPAFPPPSGLPSLLAVPGVPSATLSANPSATGSPGAHKAQLSPSSVLPDLAFDTLDFEHLDDLESTRNDRDAGELCAPPHFAGLPRTHSLAELGLQ